MEDRLGVLLNERLLRMYMIPPTCFKKSSSITSNQSAGLHGGGRFEPYFFYPYLIRKNKEALATTGRLEKIEVRLP